MRTALILSVFAVALRADSIYPLPSTLTSVGLTVPHVTESVFLENKASYDETFTLVAVGSRTPLGTHAQLLFTVSLTTHPDISIGPREGLGGSASFQINDLQPVSIDGFTSSALCTFCGPVDIVFGEPFTIRLRATSRVYYSYSNTPNPQLYTGTIIPEDTGSVVKITSLRAITDTGLREDGVLLNTAGAPEPSTVLMAVSGIGLVLWRRKRRL